LNGLDRRLASHPYLVGPQLTLADVGYVPWILRAEHRGVPVRLFEHLAAWLDRLSTRASIAAEIATVEALSGTHADNADLGFWRISQGSLRPGTKPVTR
jgi:glutathione S-transferase